MMACSKSTSSSTDDELATSRKHLKQELLEEQKDTGSGSLPSLKCREDWGKFLQLATHQTPYNDKMKGEQNLDQFLAAQWKASQQPNRTRKSRLANKSDMEFTIRRDAVNKSHSPHHETEYACATIGIGKKNKKKENPAYPAHLMPSHTHYASAELGTRGPEVPSTPSSSTSTHEEVSQVPVLPEQVILRHRLSVAEIKELPRFRDYQAGNPTKVLYVKNLHPRVSADDLKAIFDRYSATDDKGGVEVRLMTGRMKGQAFIEFQSIAMAQQAMELVNGFLVRDKPLVISYGRGKTVTRLHAREQNEHTRD